MKDFRLVAFLALTCFALTAAAADVKTQGNIVTIHPDGGQSKVVRLEVINDNIIRVRATSKDQLPQKPQSLMIVPQQAPAKGSYSIEESDETVTVKAKNVSAVDQMMKTVNISAGVGLGLVELLVLVRWLLKKKKAKE